MGHPPLDRTAVRVETGARIGTPLISPRNDIQLLIVSSTFSDLLKGTHRGPLRLNKAISS